MSKRQEVREKQQQRERVQRIIAVVALVAFALMVVGIVVVSSMPKPEAPIVAAEPLARPQVDFNATGDPNAPVKVIEYSDFQCPYCKNFYKDTEKQIIDIYVKTGKVYFQYFTFGNYIGVESGRAALAVYCAGDQGKFWEMHDALFTNQPAENAGIITDTWLKRLAESIKLDMTAFKACYDSGKYKDRITQDGVNATKAGISSTPSFLVNGKLIKGAQPFATFQQEIEAALVAAGK
jgi:protein-disulfide isomerase